MIVDNNLDDIELTRRVLAKLGRDVELEMALRGETALERLRHGMALPSLMLLDLKMPGMSGFDTLREIRADERLKNIPVVIVTSSSLESDRRKSQDAGANGFLHKSFDLDQFTKDIKALLERWLN